MKSFNCDVWIGGRGTGDELGNLIGPPLGRSYSRPKSEVPENAQQGRIIRYVPEKGFGFIKPRGSGSDVFFQIKQLADNSDLPTVGDRVTFEIIAREGRASATNIKIS